MLVKNGITEVLKRMGFLSAKRGARCHPSLEVFLFSAEK